jgi:ABC-type lipoprotein export system ATPase subunit
MSLIELKNISKVYRLGNQEIPALTDVSLALEK